MAFALDYVNIPTAAVRLDTQSTDARPVTKTTTSIPRPSNVDDDDDEPFTPPGLSTSKTFNLLPNILLSSVLPSELNAIPKNPGPVALLSTKEPLRVPITTANFRRFVATVGPVFWLQDRIEEALFWRKSWQLSVTWIAAYVFLCYFPRLILCLPHIILIAIILATQDPVGAPVGTAPEGSVDWQRNIQAIQNLMGLYADVYEAVQPYTAYIVNRSPYTPHILTLLVVTLLPAIFFVSAPTFPLRQVCIAAGVLPFIIANPSIYPWLVRLFKYVRSREFITHVKAFMAQSPIMNWLKPRLSTSSIPFTAWKSMAQYVVDNNNLSDICWNSEIREVELFENERLDPAVAKEEVKDDTTVSGHSRTRSNAERLHKSWSKTHLRPLERTAWTRGRDGWSGVGPGSTVSSNLTFSLPPDWYFVETEDWHVDVEASWASCGGDSNGWVYTNDSWLQPRPHPETCQTRRRRWTRRIFYNPEQDSDEHSMDKFKKYNDVPQ
ncbi:integral peroxisomal membrane peroxin-domain-containing protein [Mycena floridula]|nr:integral peroxisomal membrane peroxin-domain-containing protein [Mycena floridula]